MSEIEIELYTSPNGKCPFNEWFEGINEKETHAKILVRLERLQIGNFGDCKSVGDGVAELRIHYGSGIRVYYSKVENKIILLLLGGIKSSQVKDINKAKEYLKEYHLRKSKIWQKIKNIKIGLSKN